MSENSEEKGDYIYICFTCQTENTAEAKSGKEIFHLVTKECQKTLRRRETLLHLSE